VSAAKTLHHKDTYRAVAITLILLGILYLVDKLLGFASFGMGWVMNKDNFLLYTAIVFLLFKHDRSVGLVLAGLWLLLNFGLITALLGTVSAYLVPVTILLIGILLYWLTSRK
jgi:ABC-type sulfate transport system permease subunit